MRRACGATEPGSIRDMKDLRKDAQLNIRMQRQQKVRIRRAAKIESRRLGKIVEPGPLLIECGMPGIDRIIAEADQPSLPIAKAS